MKIIVYSANIGFYDKFSEPKIFDRDVRYILFTDNTDYKSEVWEVNNINFIDPKIDNARKTRIIKLNPQNVLPNHDISIWIDYCFVPKTDSFKNLIQCLDFSEDKNIMCFKHDERRCLYEEAGVVIERGLDSLEVVNRQINRYKSEGFPQNYGLYQCGFMIRRNNQIKNNFNNLWLMEVLNNSKRDQLSQVYSAWKTELKINKVPGGESIYSNSFLSNKVSHIKRV